MGYEENGWSNSLLVGWSINVSLKVWIKVALRFIQIKHLQIINYDEATAVDVLRLAERVRQAVLDKFDDHRTWGSLWEEMVRQISTRLLEALVWESTAPAGTVKMPCWMVSFILAKTPGEVIGVSRAAISKHIKGYSRGLDIYRVQGKGYKLAGLIDMLDHERLSATNSNASLNWSCL